MSDPPRDLNPDRLDRLAQAVGDLMESHAAQGRMVNRMLGALDDKISALDTKLDQTRSDIMARIDRLQDQVTQQLEAGTISVALSTNVANDAKAARESAALSNETLGLLATQVQRLNVRVAALENKGPP
jgi:hypothetical protein